MKRKIMQGLIVLTCVIVLMSSFMIYGFSIGLSDFPSITYRMPYRSGVDGYNDFIWVETLNKNDLLVRSYKAVPDDVAISINVFDIDKEGPGYFRFTITQLDKLGYYSETVRQTVTGGWIYQTSPRFDLSSSSYVNSTYGAINFITTITNISWYVDGVPSEPFFGESYPPDFQDDMLYGNMKYYVDGYRKHYSYGDRQIYVPLDKSMLSQFTNGKMTYYTDKTGVFGGHVKFPVKFDLIQDNMVANDIIYFFENAIPHASWTFEGVKSELTKGKEITGWFTEKFSSAAFKFWRIENGFELLIPLGFWNFHGHTFNICFEVDGTLYNNKEWYFKFYEGYVDENEDGIDDRTQEKDEEGNIISDGSGVPNLTPGFVDNIVGGITGGSFDSFSEIINSVKSFFSTIWGILPPEINTLILTAITIMISIAVLKVVF